MSQPWTPPPGPWGPPGPAGYSYGYGPGPGYGGGWAPPPPQPSSLRGLAIALTALLVVALLVAGIGAAVLFDVASSVDADRSFGDRIDREDKVFTVFGLLTLAYVAILSCWIVWQFRHARNAELLGRRGGLGPAWAIAGWFVPLGAIVLVPLQLLQSAKASDEPGRTEAGPTVAVLVWWALFALAFTLVLVGFVIGAPDEFGRVAAEDEERGFRVAGFGMVVGVAAAAAGAAVVRVLTDRQGEAVDRGLPPPTPMAPPGSFGGGAPPPGWAPPPSGWTPPPAAGAPPPTGWAPPPSDWGPPPPGARCARV
ncbi:MAG: DUF4328 domain-containing protein [Acidimicrobiales bacterium]